MALLERLPIKEEIDDGIRDSMCGLPGALALPLTLLTGKPHTGQRSLRFTPTMHLAGALLSLAAGLSASVAALLLGGWWTLLLGLGWAMTLHGMRNQRMMVFHQCAHRNMWNRPRLDRAVGRVLSAVLMIQYFERYSAEHVREHHALHHMTLRDPTVQAILISLELRPGMSRRQMWWRVTGKLASPLFHSRFMVSRVRSYFSAASPVERTLVVLVYGLIGATTIWLHAWPVVLVAWALPLTLFYQVSNTLRLCVKHTFPAPGLPERRGKAYFASLTNAIFIGERAPTGGLRAWTRWWLRMLFVHFPTRYLVLTGDTVCHDFHHRHPMSRRWANYICERDADARSGHRGWPPYREVWGLAPAINLVFDSLSAADPEEFDLARLAAVTRRDLFAAFDD